MLNSRSVPVVFALLAVWPAMTRADEAPLFERDVLPILKAKCFECHSSQKKKADLDLSSMAGVLKGSESGEILVKGKANKSLLYEMLHDGLMPPEGKTPLTAEEMETIARWINMGAAAQTAVAAGPAVTQHEIIPLMYLRCTVCHGLRVQEGGLDLRSKAAMLRGGKSGPAIAPGKPEESLLLKRIHAAEMPPPTKLVGFGVRPMEPAEIESLTEWIAAGAPEVDEQPDIPTKQPDPLVSDEDRQFWSFRPPQRPQVPETKTAERVRNPIDAFVLARLTERGLTLSAEADRPTLIRRVAFDLTGLPPAWSEVEAFLADKSEDAYEKMVDRYLDSPHYGERWGRYWLDVAGYADSEGKRSADPIRPHAWRYRDYVIRSFNADKPYDRFLLEQLAGDELADAENADVLTDVLADNLIATGFLRMAPDGTGSDIVNTAVERMEVIGDEINVLGSAVLGLTIKCAQCHSHKYDPIPQRDYYRLAAVFKGAFDEHDWLKPTSVPGQTKRQSVGRLLPLRDPQAQASWRQEKQNIEQQIAAQEKQLQQRQAELTEKHLAQRLQRLPEELRADLRTMLSTPAKQRSEVQKYLAEKFEKKLKIDDADLKKLDADYKRLAADVDKQVKQLKTTIPPEPQIRALWDRGEPSPTYIYRRGEVTSPGDLVGPGVPSVLTDGQTPFEVTPPWPGANKTGRRLALARWLVKPDHPLTARVMVNRIWKHHFGRGIVSTLDNFGRTGAKPTHPELLDWLACEFVSHGWSIKQMHRLMLGSSVYRQQSTVTPEQERLDPENELYSRRPLERLNAESVRDSLLAVAGRLVDRPFGKPDPVAVRKDGLVTSQEVDGGWRRSIYVMQRRKEVLTILETFDLPQMNPNCIERPDSTVAAQALHLLNNGTVRELADSFAARVAAEVGDDPDRQLERVYQIALSRPPEAAEREAGRETLNRLRQAWEKQQPAAQQAGEQPSAAQRPGRRALANYCLAILNSAAFLYLD